MPVLTARPQVRCRMCQDTGMVEVQGVATLNPMNTAGESGAIGLDASVLRLLSPARFVVTSMPCTFCPPAPRQAYRRDWERRP